MASGPAYLMALTDINGIGPVKAVSIAKRFKTSEDLAKSSREELKEIVDDACAGVLSEQLDNGWESLLSRSQSRVAEHLTAGIRPLAITEPDYPPLLRLIPDPPPVLYLKGNADILKVLDAVAVIGTRNPTDLGLDVATRVARRFAMSGFVVVSGLAKGIDSAAHRGACEAGFTVAVLANPLDKIYPAENRKLADQILRSGGALVSELALREQTFKNSFVRRDRIQSGMSLAVIPIQTDIEGGTMHTVRYAETQKRLLFCPVPPEKENGRKEYAGIKQLIQSNRAKPFDSEVLLQIREFKSLLIRDHGLFDALLPFRRPIEPEAAQAPTKDEQLLQKIEGVFRDLELDKDKKKFNALMAKVRLRLFGKTPSSKGKTKTPATPDPQGKLLE